MMTTRVSGLGTFVSFGGICGLIGTVSDLLTPVGDYTLLCLGVGALSLFVGFVLSRFIGFTHNVTSTALMFGGLLSAISIGFLVMGPGDRGVIAGEVGWVADAQQQILGLSEQVALIATHTGEIAISTQQIAQDTGDVLNLSFSSDGFVTALTSQDPINIKMYCDRGYRADHVAHLMGSKDNRVTTDRNFRQLVELGCYDVATLCAPENWVFEWHNLAPSLNEDRVATLCGLAGTSALMAKREALEREAIADDARREERYQECMKDRIATGYESLADTLCSVHRRRLF